jgi:hypothetical protein
MESKAEEYRRKAEDAEKNSEKTSDVVAKRMWHEVAEQWRDMAARADCHGW